ncbi:MAG: hypothetical protein GX575_23810 [Candidatus Anammoximicrobium sp.]|nr:hypothetical protein [Candidatus Anammoximicrobium sp.]
MTLLDWLRKLGIVRFGAESGVYRDATQRPTSLQMDGVFDSEKDVIDLNRRPDQGAATGGDESGSGQRSS